MSKIPDSKSYSAGGVPGARRTHGTNKEPSTFNANRPHNTNKAPVTSGASSVHNAQAYKRLGEGDVVQVWGEPKTIQFKVIPSPKHATEDNKELLESVEKPVVHGEQLIFRLSQNLANNTAHASLLRRIAFENFLKNQVVQRLDLLIPRAEHAIGAKTTHWTVRTMKSRWGSCRYEKGKISIATDLATHKSVYLALIAFHEVAHMRAHNHGTHFRAIMDKAIPSWRQLQKDLDAEGMRIYKK